MNRIINVFISFVIVDKLERKMFRLYQNSRSISNLCRTIGNQMSQRYQSSAATTSKVALEPNTSNMSSFSGHIKGAITHNLEFIRPENITPIPIYQVLDPDGTIKDQSQAPEVSHRALENRIDCCGIFFDLVYR